LWLSLSKLFELIWKGKATNVVFGIELNRTQSKKEINK